MRNTGQKHKRYAARGKKKFTVYGIKIPVRLLKENGTEIYVKM